MRLLSWIIMVPVALAVISFSVSNRGTVAIDLWPSPYTLEAPVFAVVLASILLGLILGAFLAWVSAGKTRRRARAMARRAEAAERDLAALREQIGGADAPAPPVEKTLPAPADAA